MPFHCLFIWAALPLVAAPVCAQDATSGDVIVVTATRSAQPLSRIGQSITLIDSDLIRETQALVVSDLLATTPGVTVSRNGGIGAVTSVRIRGAEADHTVALIDGVKLNDPSVVGGGFNFGDLLVGNIERIEVLRGPQSLLWGSQAIGGVVNIITREPTEVLQVNARAEAGYRGTAQVMGNLSGSVGRIAGSIGAGYFGTNGISAADEAHGFDERDGYRHVGANAKFRLHLSDAVSVDLRGWYADSRTELDGFPPPDFMLGDTREYAKTRQFVGYAGLNAALFDGRLKNRLAFAYTDTDRDSFDPDSAPHRTFEAKGRNERIEYQGTLDIRSDIQAMFGAERERSRMHSAAPSVFDPDPTPTRGSARIDSLYGQLIVSPIDGLTMIGGLRYDHHDRFGSATTMGGSLAYTPNAGATLLKASYGEGFKAPTLYQLQSEYGNILLKPEQAKGWDAGVEQRLLDGRILVGVTYFERRTTNQIDFISCFGNPSPICIGRPFGTYDNIGRTRADGVEFLLSLRPIEDLSIDAQYTFTDAKNRTRGSANFGRDLARRAKDMISARIDYRWRFGLSTGASVTYVGDSFEDSANTLPLEGYVLVDLRASYPIAEGVELYGRVENLFNDTYETALGYGALGRAGYAGVQITF